jgi:hypothetical protein
VAETTHAAADHKRAASERKPSQGRCQLVGTGKPGLAKRRASSRMGCVSVTHSGLSDVLPGGVCLGAELSVGGGGQ